MSDLGRLMPIRVERDGGRQEFPGGGGGPVVRATRLGRKSDARRVFPRASSTSGRSDECSVGRLAAKALMQLCS